MKTKGEAWAESMASELEQKKNIQKGSINTQKANNMEYKQSPFPMVEGTKGHTSALKHKLKVGKGQGSKRKGKYTVDPDAPGYKYGPGYEPPVTDKDKK